MANKSSKVRRSPNLTQALAGYLTYSDRWQPSKGNKALWVIVYLFLIRQAVNSPIYGSYIFPPIVQLSLKSAILLLTWMSNSHSSVKLMSCCWWNELSFLFPLGFERERAGLGSGGNIKLQPFVHLPLLLKSTRGALVDSRSDNPLE